VSEPDADLIKAARYLLKHTTGLQDDEHGTETPERFMRMLREMTTPKDIKWRDFTADYDEMIVVRDIPFVSLCNHHVVPFVGKADIGYIPHERMAGLSKFARVVHHFSRGLQLQERLTRQISDFLSEKLQPHGLAVVMEAEHLCMTLRGAQVPGTKTYTAMMTGYFNDHDRTAKHEFLSRINGG